MGEVGKVRAAFFSLFFPFFQFPRNLPSLLLPLLYLRFDPLRFKKKNHPRRSQDGRDKLCPRGQQDNLSCDGDSGGATGATGGDSRDKRVKLRDVQLDALQRRDRDLPRRDDLQLNPCIPAAGGVDPRVTRRELLHCRSHYYT